jgi:hypothetical protein
VLRTYADREGAGSVYKLKKSFFKHLAQFSFEFVFKCFLNLSRKELSNQVAVTLTIETKMMNVQR